MDAKHGQSRRAEAHLPASLGSTTGLLPTLAGLRAHPSGTDCWQNATGLFPGSLLPRFLALPLDALRAWPGLARMCRPGRPRDLPDRVWLRLPRCHVRGGETGKTEPLSAATWEVVLRELPNSHPGN